MPQNRIVKWLAWIYMVGYYLCLSISAAKAWPRMTLWDWSVYVSWESLYQLIWPILIFVR